jgi:hypothetical protein
MALTGSSSDKGLKRNISKLIAEGNAVELEPSITYSVKRKAGIKHGE